MAKVRASIGETAIRDGAADERMSRWPLDLRETVRAGAILALAAAGVRFISFMQYVQTGNGQPVARPEAADAFLPLGALAALKVWLTTGYLDVLHPASVVILVATLVTALLFKRALCSWLCPFGAVSEYLAKLGVRIMGRNLRVPHWLDSALLALKYTATFAFLFWLALIPNAELVEFMAMPFYAVADAKLLKIYLELGFLGGLVLAVIGVTSMAVKSFWCRYVCPYGALQGMLGVLSPVSIAKDDEACNGCMRCTKACPNGVEVASARGVVASAECMGCTGCVRSCTRERALSLRLLGRWTVEPAAFGLSFVAAFVVLILGAVISGNWTSVLTAEEYYQIFHTTAGTQLPRLAE